MTEKTAIRPSPKPRPSPVPRDHEPPEESTKDTSERKPRRVLVPVLVMLIVVLGVGAGVVVLYLRQDAAARVDTARAEALQAARQHVPEVLSYGFDTLDKDLATAAGATTGQFAGDLAELQRTVIRPSATMDKISTRTTVSDAGVVRAGEDEVVVLAFVNQLTTSQKQTTPRIDGARVRVTMRHVGDGWLVSALEPV